jgi:iron complex outermembrane receptor protein
VKAPTGGITFDAGSAANEGGVGGDVTVGTGNLAVHVSGSGRRSSDYRSPDGTIPNSFNRAGLGEVGVAYATDNGYFGGSYAYDRTHYGIPLVEEGQTNLNPRRQIFNLRGEHRSEGGLFESIRGSFGVRRYRHDELDGEEIATSFKNDTSELELLATHKRVDRMRGSIGASFLTRAFATTGAESLSPAVDQKGAAVYVYEEVALSPHVDFQFGGRMEHQAFTPASIEPDRSFTNVSGSVGLLVHPTDATSIALQPAEAVRVVLNRLRQDAPHVHRARG